VLNNLSACPLHSECCFPQLPHYSKGQHLRKAGHLSNQLLAMARFDTHSRLPLAH
jgi:hypothetical protein